MEYVSKYAVVTNGRNNELENDLKEGSYGLKDVLCWHLHGHTRGKPRTSQL